MSDSLGLWLKKIDRFFSLIEDSLNLLAGILVFGLMFLGVVQIILRTVLRNPIYGYIDMVEVSMVGFAVLSIAYVQRVGAHVRMELFVARLKGRLFWMAEALSSALSIFIVGLLIPYSYKHFLRSYNFGDSTIDIELLTWPAKLIVPIALSLLLIRLIIQLLGYLRLSANPELEPVAIPLLKDTESQAEEEIHQAEEDITSNHNIDTNSKEA